MTTPDLSTKLLDHSHTNSAIGLIEALADFFDTVDPKTYLSLPSSMKSVMSAVDATAVKSAAGRIDGWDLDWATSRIADLASESRRTRELTQDERQALFSQGVRMTETPTLSREVV